MAKHNTLCSNCGREMYRKPSQLRLFKKSYCSKECLAESKRTGKIFPCAVCGDGVYRQPGEAAKSKSGNVFCSRSCAVTFNNSEHRSGENNPNWVDGKSSYSLPDNAKCVDCGEDRRYMLCTHHIDGDRANNKPSNHEFLCANHHRVRHLALDKDTGLWYYLPKALTPREMIKKFI